MKFTRDVSECHEKVIKYMEIVKKTARDMVPKAIKLYVIDNLKAFIENDLQPKLLVPEVDLVSLSSSKRSIHFFNGIGKFLVGNIVCNPHFSIDFLVFQAAMFEMDAEQIERLDRKKKILDTYKNALEKMRKPNIMILTSDSQFSALEFNAFIVVLFSFQ